MAMVFGLVVRKTSIGFAVIEHDSTARTGDILRLGVRVYPEARDRWGTPKNQTRRLARMQRLKLRRRRERRRALQGLLHRAGLLPEGDSSEWRAVMRADPYELRRRAFEGEALCPHEVGRAIYHLAQRRHYKPADINVVDDAEDREVTAARAATAATLERENKTLGAWLSERGPHERKRGEHATRGVVEDEFDRVWARLVPEASRAAVRDAIFFQRPVFWRSKALVKCSFVPGGRPCPKGSWLSAQRRMLEDLNRLTVVVGAPRPLDEGERRAILEKLGSRVSLTWAGVRRALAPVYRDRGEAGLEKTLRFNLEDAGTKRLLGNAVEAKLAEIFGSAWAEHPRRHGVRAAVHEVIRGADYAEVGAQRIVVRSGDERRAGRAEAARRFVTEFGLAEDRAVKVETLKLPTGWEPYSTEALEAMLPHLQAGVRFDEIVSGPEWEAWREEAFPERERANGEAAERLPSPADPEENKRMLRLGNPNLGRARNELRKVVNNLIAVFGRPDCIRIELARELGYSNRMREEAAFRRQRLEKRRAAGRKILKEEGVADPTPEQVEKWILWEECRHVCPYTGDAILFDALFGTGDFEVEQIWPRSRSLHDGFWNKTLCRKDVAARKGGRTPFEMLGDDPESWAAVESRLASIEAEDGRWGMYPAKVSRFLAQFLGEERGRGQVRDTGYVARETKAYLGQLWPWEGVGERGCVEVVSERVMRRLRPLWALDEVLGETGGSSGGSHLGRAVEAVAVACCHEGMSRALVEYWREVERGGEGHLAAPWDEMRADVETALAGVVVSHRVSRKVSGPLHKETTQGDTGLEETRRGATYRTFVTRKRVEALRAKELQDEIQDVQVRKIVQTWVKQRGGSPAKAVPPYPMRGERGPEIRKVRLHKERQLGVMGKASTGFAELANNHHMAIYVGPGGQVRYEVVSLLEASRRLAKREPLVRRAREDGEEFVMSLAVGESLEHTRNGETKVRVVKSVWGNGTVVMVDHDDAVGATRFTRNAAMIVSNSARKLAVDPIGRVRVAGD